MSWWDDWTTRAGDALLGQPGPFGSMIPAPTGRDRQTQIGMALLQLGGNIAGADPRMPTMGAVGQGLSKLQESNDRRQGMQLQGALLGGKLEEQRRRNQTLEYLKKNPPPGVPAEMLDLLPPEAIGKLYLESQKDARTAAAYGLGGGSAPTASGGPAPLPSGGVFDIPQQFAAPVQQAAAKHGVPPQLLASTFWNESRWDPNAINKNDQGPGVHSVGIGQWGEQWARARGFNPRDPVASIDQTAAAMKEYATKYGGNFLLARLAYGWGPGNVDKWLASGGDPNALPDGAKVWLPRTAFGIAGEQEARAAFPKVAGMLRPGPVQMPWGQQPASGASSVQPAQYTPPSPAGQPQAPASDPGIDALVAAQRKAADARDWKQVGEIEKEIAKRRAALSDRGFELEKSQQQGAERAKIMRDTEVLKADVKDASEYASGIQGSALKSRTAKANLKQLGALLDGMDTGKFKSTTTDIKRMAKGLGIDLASIGVTDDVGPAEAARALVNQMALQMRDPSQGAGMPGAMSDKDREFLMSMVPGLETTPAGRKLMLQYMMRIHDYNIGLAKVVQDYRLSPEWRTQPQGVVRAAQQYAAENPIFSEADIQAVTQARSAPQQPETGGPAPFKNNMTGPKPGDVQKGYRFKGGNPADKNSWEKVP